MDSESEDTKQEATKNALIAYARTLDKAFLKLDDETVKVSGGYFTPYQLITMGFNPSSSLNRRGELVDDGSHYLRGKEQIELLTETYQIPTVEHKRVDRTRTSSL